MATVKKLIGRLPVYKGDWVAGTYSMLNQVSYLGSTFQSKIDNNTSQPATLVNNVLQVNSNWNVISNGTAAYVANDRLTACETASTYAQAGVDTLRSDVQGLESICSYTNDNSNIKSLELYFTLSNTATNSMNLFRILNKSAGADTDNYIDAYISANTYTLVLRSRFSSTVNNTKSINLDANKPYHFILSYNGATANFYLNGVLVFSDNHPISLYTTYIYGVTGYEFKGIKRYIKTFNTALTQQQIDTLYNQGRCDEVVFGDEWRGVIDNPDLSTAGNYILVSAVKTGDKSVVLNYSGNAASSHIVIKTKRKGLYRVRFKAISSIASNMIYIAGFTPAVDVKYISINNSTNTDIDVIIDNSSSVEGYIIISRHSSIATPDNITLSEIEVESINILNEYLPQYLTKTKWIDSGVNKQDIALTAPRFTYVKPYKDVEFAEGAPTTPPVASGCMRIDRTNKRAYLSILK